MKVEKSLNNRAEEYALFFVEEYARRKNISGKDAYAKLTETNAYQYLLDNFESLHTISVDNVIDDIEHRNNT